MAEALEIAKKRLGLGDGTVERKPEADGSNAVEALEKAIDQVDNIEARDLLRAKAREMKAQFELRAREAEAQLRGSSTATGATVAVGERGSAAAADIVREQERKDRIADNAKKFLDAGLDARTVAQYLANADNATIQLAPIGGGQAPGQANQGMTVKDVLDIIKLVDERSAKGDPTAAVVKTLTDEFKALRAEMALGNKPQSAVDRLKEITSTVNALVEAGLVRRPSETTVVTGTTIEETREKYRHEEKMAELTTDKWYKEKMADTVAKIPESIGKGIASYFVEGEDAAGGKDELESLVCDTCKTRIYITPETGERVKCPNPKCGQVYVRRKAPPAEAAAAAPAAKPA